MIKKTFIKIVILGIVVFLVYDCIVATTWSSFLQKIVIILILSSIEFLSMVLDWLLFKTYLNKLRKLFNQIDKKIQNNSDNYFSKEYKINSEVLIERCLNLSKYAKMKELTEVKEIESSISKMQINTQYKFLSIN